MKKIVLKNNGQMTKRDKDFFGGKFSLLERVRFGGIGSPKVIYKKGLPYFDELNEYVENEISFANFELLRDGLLIRLNRNQRFRYVGYQHHEILSIDLTGRPVEKELYNGLVNRKTEMEGSLRLNVLHGAPLLFHIQTIFFDKIKAFFSKSVFEDKFSIDIQPQTR